MAILAALVLLLDQLSKQVLLLYLGPADERIVIDGFFKLVHWTNRGAAWSMFQQFASSNLWLSVFALIALLVLFATRHHFDVHTRAGQISLGLIFGGIIGNLVDRFMHGYVIDFLYFYLERRGAEPIGFPAFNVADTAICTGVGLLFLISWQREEPKPAGAADNSKA
jgi:signal peptidase II